MAAMNLTPSDQLLAPLAPWFNEHRRSLPWRAIDLDVPHPDPYVVLVSELMLQQTQVNTVVPYFERWMERFPRCIDLAETSSEEVHRYWQGLGYYRRATYLQSAAKQLVESGWPKDLSGLSALPGLGPYTTAAIASIAFQRPEAALDGNAFRVLARLLAIRDDPKAHASILREWLRPALKAHGPSRMTQAIMELGARICLPQPRCESCPLASACASLREGLTTVIPVTAPRTEAKRVNLWLLAVKAEHHWLLHPPTNRGLLAGLWRWPSLEMSEVPAADHAAESITPYAINRFTTWSGWIQIYSHRKEHVSPVLLDLPQRLHLPSSLTWVPEHRLPELPLGKRDQRLRSLLYEPHTTIEAKDFPFHQLWQMLER